MRLPVPNDFVEFEVDGLGIAVLRVLNQKHHRERDDGRAGVDNVLPGIGEMKGRSGKRPDNDNQDGCCESPGAAE